MQVDPNDLYSRLGRIEAGMEILLARDVSTDKRLGKLERFEAKAAGIAAVVASIVGFIASKF
jgi:hypothetical protein